MSPGLRRGGVIPGGVALIAAVAWLLWWPGVGSGDPLRIAVAANFADAARGLVADWEARTGHRAELLSGSTGRHYTQIVQGAPMDVLLGADSLRPRLLEESGLGVSGSRFTYAHGRLAGWSASDEEVRDLLAQPSTRVAVANPRLAPYGEAATQALDALGMTPGLVFGENVAQAFQFAVSGGAEVALVSLAQLQDRRGVWVVPDSLYSPIVQQAILLRDTEPGRSFLRFVDGPDGRRIIESAGYRVPADERSGRPDSADARSGEPEPGAITP